jgi:hypothetical protein
MAAVLRPMEWLMQKPSIVAAARMLTVAVLMTCAGSVFAQTEPDISIRARVTARQLVFYEVPNVSVTFLVPDMNSTVWDTQRENLPDKVQPNVIYRNIGVNLTITSTLENIDEIINDALGLTTKESTDATSPSDSSSSPDGDEPGGTAAVNDDNDDDRGAGRRPDPGPGDAGAPDDNARSDDPAPPSRRRNAG